MNKKIVAIGLIGTVGLLVLTGCAQEAPKVEVPSAEEIASKVVIPACPDVLACPVVEEKVCDVVEAEVIEVDNEDMKFVLDRLEDKEIIEDAEEIVAELKAEDEALMVALLKIEGDYKDACEDEGIVDDEEDAELIKLEEKFEDVTVAYSNYDREKYRFEVKGIVEDLDEEVDKDVVFTVSVLRGVPKIEKVELDI